MTSPAVPDVAGAGMRLAQAAESLIGVPFRLGGHDPAVALDCVGMVVAALTAIGRPVPQLPRYRLREQSITRFLPLLPAHGFTRAQRADLPGDLLIVRPGPAQHHLLLLGQEGQAIHAHAGLGRVCATPMPLAWPVPQIWRLS